MPPILAALRWRLGATVALLAVAVLAVFSAAFGPLFLGAADSADLHATLVSATFDRTQINAGDVTGPVVDVSPVLETVRIADRLGLRRWYRAGVVSRDVGTSVTDQPALPYGAQGDLVYRPGVCAHLSFVSGRCPSRPFQATETARDARLLGLGLGQRVLTGEGTLTITGIVRAGDAAAPYWLGDSYFNYFLRGGGAPDILDAFFTPLSTLTGMSQVATAQFALRPTQVQPGQVPALRQTVDTFQYQVRNRLDLGTSTALGGVLSTYTAQSNQVVSIVGVVAIQLVLLTDFVLYVLVVRTAAARRSEVALARLRGGSLASVLAIGVGEPLVILVASLPLGLALAWVGVQLASRLTLGGAPVPLSLLGLLAALAALLGGLLAVAAGSRRLVTRPLVDELRAAAERPSPAVRAAIEGAAVALAVAGLVELATSGQLSGGHPNPVALFAPGLIAIAVAIVGVRLLPLACRVLIRRTRFSRRLALGLALRQVIRRPAVLRQILILTVAVGLSGFALIGWSVAGTNRTLRADFDLGAAKVLRVSFPASVNLLDAVRRADPSGRYAMAAMESRTANQDLLALDPTRLARVAYWPSSIDPATLRRIQRWLQPKLVPAMVLTGTAARMTVDLSPAVSPTPDLQFSLLDSSGNAQVADFGYLQPGLHTYTAPLPQACLGGCFVTDLDPDWYPGLGQVGRVHYTLDLSQLEAEDGSSWRALPGLIYHADYWVPSSGSTSLSGDGRQLSMTVTDSTSQLVPPEAAPAPLPSRLRAVSTAASQPTNPVHNSLQDFDGTDLNVNTSLQVQALPNLGSVGSLISMPLAIRAERGTPVDTSYYVWLAASAPARITARLRADGIRVLSVQTPARAIAAYEESGLGLGYRFFVFAAGAAAALALAASVLAFYLTARRRAFELAVMRALGVPDRTLFRALVLEQALVALPGLVLGALAAVAAALLALAAVPEFASNAGQPPLQLTIPVPLLLALLGALALVLGAAAVLAARLAVARVDLGQLRLEPR